MTTTMHSSSASSSSSSASSSEASTSAPPCMAAAAGSEERATRTRGRPVHRGENRVQGRAGGYGLSTLVESLYSITRRLPYSLNPTSSGYLPLHHPQQQHHHPHHPHSHEHAGKDSSDLSGTQYSHEKERYSSSAAFLAPLATLASPRGSGSSGSPSPPLARPNLQLQLHPHPRRQCCWGTILTNLIYLAILALALVGLATIVAFATGLIQRTPIYSEKALQDSGWTRRPIRLNKETAFQHSPPSSPSPSSSTIDPDVTIHDFTPSFPPLLDDLAALSSSPSSSSSSSSSKVSLYQQQQQQTTPSNELHLLILCPLRNAATDLAHFFALLDAMSHPHANTSLGFLVGDEDDDTGEVLRNLVSERMNDPARRYRHVSLLHKDFKVEMPSGSARHAYLLQAQRRNVMAKARTYLLTATLEPTVDWVLWLDSDVEVLSPSLFQDLLIYGGAGVVNGTSSSSITSSSAAASQDLLAMNDVIVPNAMKRQPDGSLLGFDMNNWAETEASLKLKAGLPEGELLIEGNIFQHMHRTHLADQYTSYIPPSSSHQYPYSASSALDAHPQVFSSEQYHDPRDQRMNASSPAYIGRQMELDGIGGVAALVRAEVHRMGAVFPAWIFDHQLETEAFGVLAKKLGARVVGLPNLFVLHST